MSLLSDLRSVEELELENKRVFFRLDLDLAVDAETVVASDVPRLQAAIPTLKYAAQSGARIVIGSHRGQPKGRLLPELSLEPIAAKLAELMDWDIILPDECIGEAARKAMTDARPGQAVLLENLRFHPGEEGNDEAFARELASMSDVFVNDALAASNREHASTNALPRLIREVGIGLSLRAELGALSRVLEPDLPMVAILGGTRLNERFDLISSLLKPQRILCLGGALASIFLAAKGFNVGTLKVESHDQARARTLLEQATQRGAQILLPQDAVVAVRGNPETMRIADVANIANDEDIVDIGPASLQRIESALGPAQSALWVGAMGLAGHPVFSAGTIAVAKMLADAKAFRVAIGAATLAALRQAGEDVTQRLDCVCTGGGAALEVLEGRKLPGLEVLRRPQA